MLRIDETEPQSLKLEGRIVGPWIDALRVACDRAMTTDAPFVLDVGGVDFADRTATALLRGLRTRGVRIVNASPFIRALLEATS